MPPASSYPVLLAMCAAACSSSTAPHQYRGPDGLTLTMTVPRMTVRLGDTMSVNLLVSNEQSKLVNVRLGLICPTVQLFDANGHAVAVSDLAICDGFTPGGPVPSRGFAPGESFAIPSIVQVTSGSAVPLPWIGFTVVPGSYTVTACVSGADSSSVTMRTYCAQPATLTVTQ